jgi:DNA helicase-2/ATP-dependent DNA helicase PcrA
MTKKYILNEAEPHIKTNIDFKNALNEQQYKIVTEADGPSLVLAGAGSGKTRTLIYRLAYLLEKGVHPANILLMTFTNKAAREMRERTSQILQYEPRGLWSGTFHHIGNRTLRMYADRIGYGRDFGIIDQEDSRKLIKNCMKKMKKELAEEKFPKASVVQSIISFAVNTKKTIKKVLEEKYPYFLKYADHIARIKKEYDARKLASNNMDYDDLLLKWKELLKKVPEARERFAGQFRYVMVDEYQDTNFLQADIIDILSEKHKNVLVVGDDAQAIYSFRGARVDNILNFPKRYEKAKIFKLETNYRSIPEILELANDSLQNNLNQFEKKLRAVNPALEKPALVEVRDQYMQARFITQRIGELLEEGLSYRDIAVLFRAHYHSAELEMELVKKDIPYVVRGGIRFFEQAHIKDVLAYMRIVSNPLDEVSWLRALMICPGIGPGYAERIYSFFRKTGRDLMAFVRSQDLGSVLPAKARTGYGKFAGIMRALTEPGEAPGAGSMVKLVLDKGYELHAHSTYDNAQDRIDDINELAGFSAGYEDLNSFLNDITLREAFSGEGDLLDGRGEGESLVLSTIHQAKGLEWDTVVIIGLCEGQFPNSRAYSSENDLEEERRLFYVAATRAKKRLYMIHPFLRYDFQKGTIPAKRSVFLDELPSEDYEVWQAGPRAAYEDGIDDEPDLYDEGIIEL